MLLTFPLRFLLLGTIFLLQVEASKRTTDFDGTTSNVDMTTDSPRLTEDSYLEFKSVYEKVIAAMKADFNSGSLTEEQKANATNFIVTTQKMLASSSFAVLGLETQENLTQEEILRTLDDYRDSGKMTDKQNQQISKLAVDTQIRLIQELAPLLGLDAASLELSSAQFNHLMTRPTFVIKEPVREDVNYKAPTTEDVNYKAPTTEDVKYEAPTTEDVNYKAPTTEDLNYKAPTTEDVNYKAPTTKDVNYKAPTTEDQPLSQRDRLLNYIYKKFGSGYSRYPSGFGLEISSLRWSGDQRDENKEIGNIRPVIMNMFGPVIINVIDPTRLTAASSEKNDDKNN